MFSVLAQRVHNLYGFWYEIGDCKQHLKTQASRIKNQELIINEQQIDFWYFVGIRYSPKHYKKLNASLAGK